MADLLLDPYDSTRDRFDGVEEPKDWSHTRLWRFSDHHPDKGDLKAGNILVQTALYQPYYGVGD